YKDEVTNSYTYDVFGRVISSTSDDGSVQNYTYDDNSNVTAYELTKDGVTENSIVYEYNSLNRLTELANNGIIIHIIRAWSNGAAKSFLKNFKN
ncbi:MAG: hypothetical protein LUH07_10060, partial [Lachnospiraceae bacterium]|nr:hypothetical protein [Lachnospiraceae bacterium]